MQAPQWPARSQPRPLAQDQGSQPQLAGAPGAPGAAHSDGPRPAQLLPGASSLFCSPRSASRHRRCPALAAAGSGLSSAYVQRPPAYACAACLWLLLKAVWRRQPWPAGRPAERARRGGSARGACSGARRRTGGPPGRSAQAGCGAGAAAERSAPARCLGPGQRSRGGYGAELRRASGASRLEQRPGAAAAGEQTLSAASAVERMASVLLGGKMAMPPRLCAQHLAVRRTSFEGRDAQLRRGPAVAAQEGGVYRARSSVWTQGCAGARAGCRCCNTALFIARQGHVGRLQRRRARERRQRRAQLGLRTALGGRPCPSAQTGSAPRATRRQGRCQRRPPAAPARRRGPPRQAKALRARARSQRRRRRWQTGMRRGRTGAGRGLRRGQRRCCLVGQTRSRPRAARRHRSLAAWRPRCRTPFRLQPRQASLPRPRALCLRAGQQVRRPVASSGVLRSLHNTGSHLGARGKAWRCCDTTVLRAGSCAT